MSTLQHERITALAQELRLQALPDLYGAVAQSAAKRKDASYAMRPHASYRCHWPVRRSFARGGIPVADQAGARHGAPGCASSITGRG